MFARYTPTALIILFKLVIDGLRAKFPDPLAKILMAKKEWLVTDIIAILQQFLAIFQAPEEAHKALTQTVRKRDKAKPEAEQFLKDLRAALVPILGGADSQEMKDFGFSPAKDRKDLTAAQVVERTAKSKQTREERHTMGKKQKKNVKGGGGTTNDPNAKQ